MPMNSTAQKLLILLVGLGLMLMLGTTVYQRLTSPSLVSQGVPKMAQQAAMDMGGMPEGLNQDSELGRLMRMVGEQPNNPDMLMDLGVTLISQGKFQEAGMFLERARAMDVNNADIPYYLGYVAHKLNNHEQAVTLMEESLRLSNRAEVQFSVANVLRYFLHDEARALDHITQGLAAPDCTEQQRAQYSQQITSAPR